ncbi:DNA mismatch repair endonuclease MutL [Apilactobacillus apisilvae]|uniref:DNA mismatch repair protein MutL n=1 Tax=Apilactobacillus apisilvae TaxID=2923364 RepID=A0ABY4PHA6_9LACO|nr:DNA mismatch repair endonuclease MutL [Apilactobacillus apisilvae]UQS85190.1 DNA mismatch repair endonuclease MutL [Apilactobacillus apisilvae]
MPKIHELTPVLADQIAAGEVVERPASVIKELVENSIDAKSSQIDINIKDAGLKSMQVVDDGYGIDNNDIKLAFKRHATSKINNPQDLFKVHSLGFRGEALPSIASVSDVKLKTSTGDEGTSIHIKGSKIESIMPSESRRGTNITVSDLFYNTPARLKYMKSLQTELSKITDIVDRLAIGHPNIAFSLVHNNREIIRTSGRNNLQQVIGDIYGSRNLKKMISINNQDDDFKISGYVSLPELTRSSRNYVTIILNGRYVKNFNIFKALNDGYGSKLMVGRYPIVALNIKLDPTLTDVNVHPTKQTVRISKEEQLCNLITKTVYESIFPKNLIPDAMTRERGVKPKYQNTDQIQMDLNKASTQYHPSVSKEFKETIEPSVQENIKSSNVQNSIIVKNKEDLKSKQLLDFKEKYDNEEDALPFGDTSNETKNSDENKTLKEETRFPKLRYIGQLHGTYLIAESDNGMYILDQHAAQERINYEKFRVEIGEVSENQQNLLVPLILDYPASDSMIINNKMDILHSVGINIEIFGQNSFVVKQHPTWIKSGEEESTIRSMIDWVIDDKKISVASFRAKAAIMMSCKRAIKANHHLDRKQAVQLISDLSKANNPFNCPHGRPVLVSFSNGDMEKMFKRIQDPHKSE